MLTLSARNILRRPVRSALTAAAVALAIAGFVVLIGLSRGMVTGFKKGMAERGTHLLLIEGAAMDLMGSSVPETLATRIRSITGVAAVAGELLRLLPTDKDEQALVSGLPDQSYLWRSLNIVDGRLPRPGEHRVVVLGQQVAAALAKRPGDTIGLLFTPFKVVGVSRSTSLLNRSTVTMPLVDLQQLAHRSGQVTVLHIRLMQPNDAGLVAKIRAMIMQVAKGYTVERTDQLFEELRSVRVAASVAWSISAVALVMGIFGVINALLIAVAERVGEIATLSAVGWSRARILVSLQIEGLIIAVIGGLVGTAVGLAGAEALSSLPETGGLVEPEVTVALVLQAIAAVVLLGAAGAFIPAWRATQINPAEGLRKLA